MYFNHVKNGVVALLAGVASTGAALAQPLPYPPSGAVERVWYGQSFYQGGVQYPAGGYNGGRYRPTAYSAADVYVTPVWGYGPARDCFCAMR